MSNESSDWKKFIPQSDKLVSLYAEMEKCSKQVIYDKPNDILPPINMKGYSIYDEFDMNPKPTDLEVELESLIHKYDTLIASGQEVKAIVDSSIKTLNSIEKQYNEVSEITSSLHGECEEYLNDEESLTRVLKELQEPLSYFRDLTVITSKIGLNSIYRNEEAGEKSLEMEYDLYCNELTPIIERIIDCLQFFRSHPLYVDGEAFISKYTTLLNHVYSMIRNKFTSLLKNCIKQIGEKSDKNTLLVPSSPLYYYMSAISRGNTQLISHILLMHSLCNNELDGESCFDLYCSTRESLIHPLFEKEINAIVEREDTLEKKIRSSVLMMIEVCSLESENYISFFCHDTNQENAKSALSIVRSSPSFNNSISGLLEDLCMVMYECLRPLLLHTVQLDVLCDVIHMMKMDIIASDVVKRDSLLSVVIPIIIKLEEDVQERMLFVTHSYIENSIKNYAISQEDLNYPEKLYQYYVERRNKDYNMYSIWYVPVQKVLRILSLLYTCVDYTIMSDITAEGITAALYSISQATIQLSSQQSVIDGELFRIKTLLILREQISPFDLHSNTTYLPFSETAVQDHILYKLFRRAIPTMNFINQDGLRLIEDSLKASTNHLIEAICLDVCTPVITVVQQYERFMSEASSGEDHFPLLEDHVVNLIASFHDGVDRLDDIVGKIALYIDSPATQGILFAPVRRMLSNNSSHLKEILVHVKPNNFERYLEQLNEIEKQLNEIDATKYSHDRAPTPITRVEKAADQEEEMSSTEAREE